MTTTTPAEAAAEIGRVRVLLGHTDRDTAFVQDDYPYGRRLRCKRRVWVETAASGAKRGQQRAVYQTTDPTLAGEQWNKPHPGQYSVRVWLYLDGDEHVQTAHLSAYGLAPDELAWLRLTGVLEQVSDADRALVERLAAALRARYPKPWDEWDALVAFMAGQIRETGQVPARLNGSVSGGGHTHYIGHDRRNYDVAVAAARAKLAADAAAAGPVDDAA